jgi:hypothetical protein
LFIVIVENDIILLSDCFDQVDIIIVCRHLFLVHTSFEVFIEKSCLPKLLKINTLAMKTGKNLMKGFLLAVVLFSIFCACEEVENPGPNPSTDLNANDISDKLILDNAVKISGQLPASSNLSSFQIDKDTIFLFEGFKNRIRIRNPNLFGASWSILLKVDDADAYFNIEPVEAESSDSIGVFYLGIDIDKLSLPATFIVKIKANDGKGGFTKEIGKPIKVEKKGAGKCNPWRPGSHWIWLYTNKGSDIYFSAPGKPVGIVASINGCCVEGNTVDCISNQIPEEDWISMDYAVYEMGNLEYMTLSPDGTMTGELIEQTQNINPIESDFCSKTPAYFQRTRYNKYKGTYTYNTTTGNVTFTSLEVGQTPVFVPQTGITYYEYDKCYLKLNVEYEMVSCSYLIETVTIEGQTIERIFERRSTPISGENGEYAIWFD